MDTENLFLTSQAVVGWAVYRTIFYCLSVCHRELVINIATYCNMWARAKQQQATHSEASRRQVPPVCTAFLDPFFFAQVRGRRIIILPTIFRIVSPSPHKVIRWRKRVVCAFGNMRDDKKEIGQAILGFLECWVAQKPPMRRSALLSVG